MMTIKSFKADAKLWVKYATFLFEYLNAPDRARALLDRALLSVPDSKKKDLIREFAQLEYKCRNGDPERGATIFEGLTASYPKSSDLWDVQIELERRQGATDKVRQLFERMAELKMKKKRARDVFKRWLEFEEGEGEGGEARVDHVKLKASEYVQRYQKDDEGDL